jgi:hypothetical protein
VDRLLETLRSQGQIDSAGRFSLDAERGLALLARSHGSDPHRGLLFAISAALLGDAQNVQVHLGLRSLTLIDDGPPLSQEEAQTLFSHLVSRRHLRLHHLALALHTLSGTRFRALTYDTPRHRLIWTGAGFAVRPQTRKRKGNQLMISGYLPRNPLRGVAEIEQILQAVREKGRFVADRLQLNRAKVSRGIVLPPDTPAAVEFTQAGVPIRYRDSRPKKPSPGHFTGALWLKSQASKTSEFILTEGGLEVQWLDGPLGYPGWEAVVEAPHLERDLQGQVIVNRDYRNFLHLLQAQAFELLEKVDFPDRLRPPFLAQRFPPRSDPPAQPAESSGAIHSRVHISWDGRFAVIPYEGALTVFEVAGGMPSLRLPPVAYQPETHRDFAICPGTSILTVIDPHSRDWVDAYDCRSGELQASYPSPQRLTGLAYSPDGMTLFLFQAGQAVLALDTATGQETLLYASSSERFHDICQGFPSPDGSRLAVQLKLKVLLIELDSGRVLETIAREFCDWSPEGDRFLGRTFLGHGWIGEDGQLASPAMRPEFLGSRVLVGPQHRMHCFFGDQLRVYEHSQRWREVAARQGQFACHAGALAQLKGSTLALADKEILLEHCSQRLDWTHSRWLASLRLDGRIELIDLEQGLSVAVLGSDLIAPDPPPDPPAPWFRAHCYSELGLVEIWDSEQRDLLVSYQTQSADNPLQLALASHPTLEGGQRRLCLHPSGRWSLWLHLGEVGFHVLACYPGHHTRPVSACRLSGAYSERVAMAFSHSGHNLALQIAERLYVFSFQAASGHLELLQSQLLTGPHWFWSGDVLYPFLEAYHTPPSREPPSRQKPREFPPVKDKLASWPLVDCLPGCRRRQWSEQGLLVTESSDQLIVWQVSEGKPLWSLDCPRTWCLCGHSDSLALVPEDDLCKVEFYELGSGKKLGSHQHEQPLHRLAYPTGCPWLILIEWRSEMPVLLDLGSGVVAPLAPDDTPPCDRPLECQLSPDGQWLTVEGQRYLHLYNLPSRSLSRSLNWRSPRGWSGDSTHFLTACGQELEMRSVGQASPILRDRPLLLTDRHQLNQNGDWVLYRTYDPTQGSRLWQGRRAGAPGLTLTLKAEQVTQAGGQIAWTREHKLFLAEFPIFAARTARLSEPSRSLNLSAEHLSSLSVHDRIHHWWPPTLEEFPALGQSLAPGRRAQMCALKHGILLRSSRSLTVWEFSGQPEEREHGGWAQAALQECQGLIAHHAGREAGWQILDDQARLLWSAPEVHLLNARLALTREPGELPWVVKAANGERQFQVKSWPEHLPLSLLGPSALWSEAELSQLEPAENIKEKLVVPTHKGPMIVTDEDVSLLPDLVPLPLTQHLAWHPDGELFLSVYPGAEGGCRLCSYNLGSQTLQPGPEVAYVPVGGPRLNEAGTRVALQVLNRIQLASLNPHTGELEELPIRPVLPPGCGWGWVGNKLAMWRANWIQLHDQDGKPRFRIYLRHDQVPLVVTPQGPGGNGELREFWASRPKAGSPSLELC